MTLNKRWNENIVFEKVDFDTEQIQTDEMAKYRTTLGFTSIAINRPFTDIDKNNFCGIFCKTPLD